jgi:hypothetical protein
MYIDDVSILDNSPVELTSPYAKADLGGLRTFQAADVIYLLHSDYAPRKIERRGDKSWSIVEAFFQDGPYLPENPDTDLDERQLIVNGFFENGLEGWDDQSAGTSRIDHNGTDNVAEHFYGNSATSQRTSVTVDSALTHIVHVQTLSGGGSAVNDIDLGTSASGTEYRSTPNKAGWQTIVLKPNAAVW